MTIAASSHGIIVARALAATPTVFTDIAELDSVGLPELTRNEFDASVQNRNIDSYVMGMLRRKSVQLGLNWLEKDASHDHLTGLYAGIINNTFDGYKFYTASGVDPQFSTFIWIASGNVQALAPKVPTDGKAGLTATLRFSGVMSINGVTFGT